MDKNTNDEFLNEEQNEDKERLIRDRKIDTVFLLGIILGYVLLEININKFLYNPLVFAILLVPVLSVILTAPLFKRIDKKPRKKPLPLWVMWVIMAVLTDIFYVICQFEHRF